MLDELDAGGIYMNMKHPASAKKMKLNSLSQQIAPANR